MVEVKATRGRKRAPKVAATATPDPIEIAMETLIGETTPQEDARLLLVDQRKLLRLQIRKERASVHLRGLLVGAAALAVATVGWMMWDASRHQVLVVKPFSVPPDLAEKGLTGEAVAGLVLDRVRSLQLATDTARPAASYKNAWAEEDLKLEIPSTGLTVSDVERLIGRFGHKTEVSGEVFRTDAGLSLNVRASGVEAPASVVRGSDADVEALLNQAAEALYAQTQPYRYAMYLNAQDRNAEADAILSRLVRSGDPMDQAWAHIAIGLDARDRRNYAGAVQHFSASMREGPFGPGQSAMARMLRNNMGRDEEALKWSRIYVDWESKHADTAPAARAQNLIDHRRSIAASEGDFARALELSEESMRLPDYLGFVDIAVSRKASALLALHRPAEAARVLASAKEVSVTTIDLAGALKDPVAIDKAIGAQIADSKTQSLDSPRAAHAAEALMAVGRLDQASAVLASTRSDCHPCLLARARLADLKGDPVAADRWFAEAVRQGPSLPVSYERWAEARLARGQAQEALALFKSARARAPRWADPRKGEGDSLSALGQNGAALRAYAAAAERAPAWGALYVKWGEALQRDGQADAAREAWSKARGMDLSAAERSRLGLLLGRPGI